MLVVGEREAADGTVALRRRRGGQEGAFDLTDIVSRFKEEISGKK
jgi:threonyl-tRNA synthetase